MISIHALVKRATTFRAIIAVRYSDFNPRPREEGDPTDTQAEEAPKNFNPRPREEGDSRLPSFAFSAVNFNPRPREEGDRYIYIKK